MIRLILISFGFPGFIGILHDARVVKSLGAWGGDFVLAASAMDSAAITAYFKSKGLNTIIPYEQMVL